MGFKLYLGLCVLTLAVSTYLIIYQNNFEKIDSMKPFEPEPVVQASQPINQKDNETKKQVIETLMATVTAKTAESKENDKITLQKKTFDKPGEVQPAELANNSDDKPTSAKVETVPFRTEKEVKVDEPKPLEIPQSTTKIESSTKVSAKITDSSTTIKSSPETSSTTTESITKTGGTTTDSSTDTSKSTKSSTETSTSTTAATVVPTFAPKPADNTPLQSAVKKTENIMKIKKKNLPPWKTE